MRAKKRATANQSFRRKVGRHHAAQARAKAQSAIPHYKLDVASSPAPGLHPRFVRDQQERQDMILLRLIAHLDPGAISEWDVETLAKVALTANSIEVRGLPPKTPSQGPEPSVRRWSEAYSGKTAKNRTLLNTRSARNRRAAARNARRGKPKVAQEAMRVLRITHAVPDYLT